MIFRNMSINISPNNCKYRAEGNASLVIYLKKEEKVLRLPKIENTSKVSKKLEETHADLENQIEMIENVMKPLLGKDFVHCPLIVFLCSEELRLINDIVRKYRPVHRIHKNVEEIDSYVFMFPDYCCLPPNLSIYPSYGPVICIEIKPKHGYWKEFHSGVPSSHLPLCHFCMMQHYKIKQGTIIERSGYCPSDLFSGCHSRMFHALKMLLQTPQNNFRMFKNQELVYSEEEMNDLNELLSDFFNVSGKRFSDLLCNLIIQALLKPFPQQFNKNVIIKQSEILQCANAHNSCSENDPCHELPKNSALSRVLHVQKLDNLDIRKLYPLFLELKKHSDEPSDYIGCFSRSDLPPFLGEPTKVPDESEYQYYSRKVWEFLIALTMKDCSIMLVMKQLDKNCAAIHQNVIFDDHGNVYLFSISIADLDAKPLSKVEKVYKTSLLLETCFN